MTGATLVLVLLVAYRLTLLVTSDTLTERPRRWAVRRLTGIGEHEVVDVWWHYDDEDHDEAAARRAGRAATLVPEIAEGLRRHEAEQRGDVETRTYTWHAVCSCGATFSAPGHAQDARDLQEEHRIERTTPDNRLAYLLTCPWCVSFWLAAPVAWSGWCFGDRAWWTVPAAALAGSAAAGFLTKHAAPG